MHLSEGMAEHFALAWCHETLNRVQQEAITSLGNDHLAQRLADLNIKEAHLISGRENDLLPGLQSLADKILIDNSFPVTTMQTGNGRRRRHIAEANVDKQSPGYWKMVELLKRGQLEAIRRERQDLRGQPVEVIDPIFTPVLVQQQSVSGSKGEMRLFELIELSLSEEGKSERTELDHRAAFRPMTELVGGETSIGELMPRHLSLTTVSACHRA